MERGNCISKITEFDFSVGDDDSGITVKRICARDPLLALITYLEQVFKGNFNEESYASSSYIDFIVSTKSGGFKYILNDKIEYTSSLLFEKSKKEKVS